MQTFSLSFCISRSKHSAGHMEMRQHLYYVWLHQDLTGEEYRTWLDSCNQALIQKEADDDFFSKTISINEAKFCCHGICTICITHATRQTRTSIGLESMCKCRNSARCGMESCRLIGQMVHDPHHKHGKQILRTFPLNSRVCHVSL